MDTNPTSNTPAAQPIVNLPALIAKPQFTAETAPIAPALDVSQLADVKEFNPLDHLDQTQVEQLKAFAKTTIRQANPAFDDTMITEIIDQFGADAVPEVDAILQTIKDRDSAGLDKELKDVNKNMERVTGKIPKVDPAYVAKIERGVVLFQNMSGYIRELSEQIKDTVDFWTSLDDKFKESDAILGMHEKKMNNARIAINKVALREFDRAMKQMQLCGTLRLLNEEVGVRVGEIVKALPETANKLSLQNEERRLEGTLPILLNARLSLEPLIPTTEQNGKIFIDQRNDAALQWFRLWLFRHFGIAQWKVATLQRLNAIASAAADLALEIATKAMNEATQKGTQAYKEQMARTAENVKKLMIDLENVRAQSEAVIEAGNLLVTSLKEADDKRKDAEKVIEHTRNKVEDAHTKWVDQLRQIAAPTAAA